ncbi:MAG: heme/copper-type cytochrome/quinol oxidase subunit 2 [Maribacter sp.]|jgi:heme/copper-type cytochrome/quinol oxidase subunit 2
MTKKQLFKIFFNLGLVQVFPVILAMISLIGITTIVIAIILNPLNLYPQNPSETSASSNSILVVVAIFCAISLFLLSGLITFLLSSFHFIRAKKINDYDRLVTGMKHMNWAWLILSLFITIMFSLFVFKIITDIGYQYY